MWSLQGKILGCGFCTYLEIVKIAAGEMPFTRLSEDIAGCSLELHVGLIFLYDCPLWFLGCRVRGRPVGRKRRPRPIGTDLCEFPGTCKNHTLESVLVKNTLYKEYTEIYTDGSKINDRTGCAYVVNDTTYKVRLTKHSSVFSAELFAILKSLRYVKK